MGIEYLLTRIKLHFNTVNKLSMVPKYLFQGRVRILCFFALVFFFT